MTRGTDLIAAERDRHVSEEGYDAEHDRGHAGQLAAAGASYAFGQGYALQFPTEGGRQYLDRVPAGMWPWAWNYWKPSRSAVRTLVKAGALIAAAIDALLDEQDARSNVQEPAQCTHEGGEWPGLDRCADCGLATGSSDS